MQHILIPLKQLVGAKTRLAAVLAPEQRRRLVMTMLTHVVTTAQAACGKTAEPMISLVSNEPTSACLAQQLAVGALADEVGELNGALTAARALLAQRGVTRLLVLAADLPRLTVADVRALLAGLDEADVVIGPDRAQRGTNALALRLPAALALPLQYGPDSAVAHQAAAQQLGLRVQHYRSPTLGFDVDDVAGLAEVQAT